jgi:hypothetical protein
MPKAERRVTRDDILPMEQYGAERRQRRRSLMESKARRRVAVGPYATFYFENYDTMWLQIHEMLFIERGGEAQIADELEAYNPLIPQGSELVATLMFEIEDPVRRKNILGRLGGVEETVTLRIGEQSVRAAAERDVDRTTAEGKASSVHFLHFPLTAEQAAAFKSGEGDVILGIGHPDYRHMAVFSDQTRAELVTDLD